MIIGVIISAIAIGYLVGMYIVDRYINQSQEEIDNQKTKPE